MSSPSATKLAGVARLGLAAATLLVAGCQNYAARRDTLAFHAGEAAAWNRAVHTVDPWPAASTRADIDFDGPRAVRAIERYEQGEPAAAGAPPGLPMPAPAPGAIP
jgi:hypothetical protein